MMSNQVAAGFICACLYFILVCSTESARAAPHMGHHSGKGGSVLPILAAGAVVRLLMEHLNTYFPFSSRSSWSSYFILPFRIVGRLFK
ncbi:hypothetical protein CEXT_78401 [Caerostris extrusa]|uniref:Secreted protein n=1 Tax=Caerostris extrusa TaxID=172846 RepID=A0AAV4XIW3_CAEEX|nr:hypothetical protein CEXT_78401 [Caerostris extrusa]